MTMSAVQTDRQQQLAALETPRAVWRAAPALLLAALMVIGLMPAGARAARVSGILTGYTSSRPLASRDLHFDNTITGDIFLSPTHSDGSFAVSLPPGTYSLRTETGAVLMPSVRVDSRPITLGTVSELAPYAPQRLWQRQSRAATLLTSPAPSTAYVLTADTTPLPADAAAVAKPEIDWSQPPASTQASANEASVANEMPLPQVPSLRGPLAKTPPLTGENSLSAPLSPMAPGAMPNPGNR